VSDPTVGLGAALSLDTCNCVPLRDSRGVLFTAAGRLDNRGELAGALELGAEERSLLPDLILMYRAWLRWGDSSAERMFGDWAFAAWSPETRRLFLARDRSGSTAVYYHAGSRFFAFSSSRRALLKLNLAPVEMDELYLAQILVGWPAYHGERTIHKQIKRLPPGHCLAVTQERIEARLYWQLENTPELLLPRNDYIPAFREIFDRAVSDRLRGDGPFGVTLSGGLDSTSVAITGAGYLKEKGRRLPAFTAVPIYGTAPYTGERWFGDELPLAQATAEAAGNIDVVLVDGAGLCPIEAIRRGLRISLEPKHAASNGFWVQELRRMAVEKGCRVLLTGQMGNHGISWNGDIFSQPLLVRIRELGYRRWIRRALRRNAPETVWRAYRRRKVTRQRWRNTAIHPDFADRLDLINRYLDDPRERRVQSPILQRCFGTNPGSVSFQGANQAEMGAAFGLEMRDPTGDARVLAFCFSVPDRIFIEPRTGLDRWLIREAMKGRLPESVRMNRRRGRQAADLVPRLRHSAAAVDDALTEIERGPAADYVSVPALRRAWQKVRSEDTPEASVLAGAVLARGIMAGLFVNGFGTDW
jgi:asparagine synthase (glutamine-hydrolysing)